VFAVCEGGSDVAALLVTVLVIAAWIWVTVLTIRGASDRRERKALIALVLVSSLLGPAILFGLLDGVEGDNDQLLEIIITLLLPGLIGACVVARMRMADAARAFFLALWAAVFLPGAYIVLVFSFLVIGSACWAS
jgi:hypothetical protein